MTPPSYPPFTGYEPCAQTDPELFFPELGKPTVHPEKVKAICRRCDMMSECLTWALWFEDDGIWGGTSGGERRMIRRRLGISRLPSRHFAA